MILDLIIQSVIALFSGFFGLFPAFSFPASVSSAASNLGTALQGANSLFPVATLGACIAVLLTVRLGLLVFGVLVWIWEKIPFN